MIEKLIHWIIYKFTQNDFWKERALKQDSPLKGYITSDFLAFGKKKHGFEAMQTHNPTAWDRNLKKWNKDKN